MTLPNRIGSIGGDIKSTSSGTVSVDVAAGTQLLLVGTTGYNGTAGFMSDHPPTISGQAFDGVIAGDLANADMMGALFYKWSPPTGSGLSLAFNWTVTPSDGVRFAWGCYKDVDTSGFRDSQETQQAGAPHGTSTLLSPSGDLIVAFGWQFVSANRTFAWTGATEVAAAAPSGTSGDDADWSWAEATPSGNQTVSFSVTGEDADGGVAVVVLKPGTASPDATVTPSGFSVASSLGSVVKGVAKLPTGQSFSASLGTATVSTASQVTVSPTGLSISSSLGTFGTEADIAVLPTGGALAFTLGTPTTTGTTGNVNIVPNGFAPVFTLGAPTVVGDVVIRPTGVSFASALGTPTVAFPALTMQPSGFLIQALLNTVRVSGPSNNTTHRIRPIAGKAHRTIITLPTDVDVC